MPCFRSAASVRTLAQLITIAIIPAASGVPASPFPVTVHQPDGTPVTLQVRGGPGLNWFEDADGYVVTVVNGEYRYAARDAGGALVALPLLAGIDDPAAAGLAPDLAPTRAPTQHGGHVTCTSCVLPGPPDDGPSPFPPDFSPPQPIPASGTVKNLVVLCKFSNHTTGVHTRAREDYDTLYNAVGGDGTLAPTGSVRDVFTEMSYGTMTLESTVVAWVTLPQSEAYYAAGSNGTGGAFPNNAQGMVRDALDLVDPLVDFGDFDTDNDGFIDAISIIHSGYGAETGGGGGNWIWSHKWALWQLPGGRWTSSDVNGSAVNVKVYDYHTEPALWGTGGNAISRIGVAAHEAGHFFGLPDLYDIDSSSRGIGAWCMMANSWGFDGSQLRPPHFSAWCKEQLGWVTPTVLSSNGTYTANRVQDNAQIYKVTQGFPSGEYLLIENRQAYGYDSLIPGAGLAIWHIDGAKSNNADEGYPGQSGWPGNNKHYKVALLQADGNYNLEKNQNTGDSGDLYRSGHVALISSGTTPNTNSYQGGANTPTNVAISSISASGAAMTFDYSGSGVTGTKAAMTSPTPSSTLSGSSVTFSWNAGTNVSAYYLWVGSASGTYDIYDGDHSTPTAQSRTVSGIPTNGSTIHVRLYSQINGVWDYNAYTYTAATISGGTKAAMTSPTPSATLSGASVTFNWDAGTNVSAYYLWVGSASGTYNLYDGDHSTPTSQSRTVSGLPTDGSTIYVRLWSQINGTWDYNAYTYTAATISGGTKAAMTSPTPSSTLSGSSVTFNWNAGTNVSQYYLWVGNSSNSYDIYAGNHATPTAQSRTVTGIPTDGRTIYVRVWSLINGAWDYNAYTYTAATVSAGTKAAMTSPTPSSTLSGSSVTFNWNAGTNVSQYYLWVGNSNNSYDIYAGDHATPTAQSRTVTGIPTDGRTIHVRVWSLINGTWDYNAYTYTAATVTPAKAAMTSPTPSSTLSGTSATFNWNAGTGVSQYYLWVGTSDGAYDLYAGDHAIPTSQSRTVSGLPSDGSTIYVRVWSLINGTWDYNAYTYTAATVTPAKAAMTTPTPSSTLSGSTVTFSWDTGTAVSQYYLWVGNASTTYDIYAGNHATPTARTRTVTGIPTDGRTIYVRVWSLINGTWDYNAYTYTAPSSSPPAPSDGRDVLAAIRELFLDP